MISANQLISIGVQSKLANLYVQSINDTLTKYSINTSLRICHFLAQILHETGMFNRESENLNYSAQGLLATFPSHFTADEANQYAHHPQAIANRVYANRYGNGDEASGDGARYSGKGAIEITFKDNYAQVTHDTGVDFVTHPELVAQLPYCISTAGWFWNKHNLNHYADADDVKSVTHIINGGYNGLDSRSALVIKCKSIITV